MSWESTAVCAICFIKINGPERVAFRIKEAPPEPCHLCSRGTDRGIYVRMWQSETPCPECKGHGVDSRGNECPVCLGEERVYAGGTGA